MSKFLAEAAVSSIQWFDRQSAILGVSAAKAFRDPDLNDGLPCDTQSVGLFIQRMNHPCREIHIHTPRLFIGPFGAGQVEVL